MEIVGQRIRFLRERLGMTQEGLGKAIGVRQSTINRYEMGNAEPAFVRMVAFADFFDVSLDYLFGRTDEPRGKLYDYEPDVLREKFEDEAKMKAFVEFCFEPGSAGNEKLKAVLVEMLGGNQPKKKK